MILHICYCESGGAPICIYTERPIADLDSWPIECLLQAIGELGARSDEALECYKRFVADMMFNALCIALGRLRTYAKSNQRRDNRSVAAAARFCKRRAFVSQKYRAVSLAANEPVPHKPGNVFAHRGRLDTKPFGQIHGPRFAVVVDELGDQLHIILGHLAFMGVPYQGKRAGLISRSAFFSGRRRDVTVLGSVARTVHARRLKHIVRIDNVLACAMKFRQG